MAGLPGEATLVVVGEDVEAQSEGDWVFQGHDVLLKDIRDMVKTKRVGASILYALLLFLALLAVFDGQVLNIFRRRREIGTLVALGMTRGRVVALFTVEGTLHAVLAALVGAVYGVPLLILTARKGIGMPASTDDYGLAVASRLYPSYSAGLVLLTIAIVLGTVLVVSYVPSLRVARMSPTDAIRGKTA